MRINRSHPQDFAGLLKLVQGITADAPSVVMQTGHFLLYQDDVTGNVLPSLSEYLGEPRHSQIRENYGRFPNLTWSLGLRLLAELPASDKRVLVIVNDWEYLSQLENRGKFYTQFTSLPPSYRDELFRYRNDIKVLQPEETTGRASTGAFYSERDLRNRYQQHVARLIGEKRLPTGTVVKKIGESFYCSLPDAAGSLREAYCSGKTGDCAGEVAELIYDASSRMGAKCFINLYPLVCRKFVERGSELSVRLLGSTCSTIINIGFQSTGVRDFNDLLKSTEVSVHQ
jgi:hypothetical protein